MLSGTVKRYMRDQVKIYFGLLKIQTMFWMDLGWRFRYGQCVCLCFSAISAALPRGSFGGGLIDLIEWDFRRVGSPCIACNDNSAFFASEKPKRCRAWSCRVCWMHWPFCWTAFSSVWHQAVWIGGWGFYGHSLCSPGCRFIPVLLWEGLYDVYFWW